MLFSDDVDRTSLVVLGMRPRCTLLPSGTDLSSNTKVCRAGGPLA
ncbi:MULTISPECIES: hypothetical protein [Myxococcus]|nr:MULTISPECIES: hypothetical protein [Myxococcus]